MLNNSQKMADLQCCVWLLAEMPSSRAVFDLYNRKSGVNRHLRFCQFRKNSKMCRLWVSILTLKYAVSGAMIKWIIRTQHGTLPSVLEIDKTAGANSLQIFDYLNQIQRETNSFLIIARHCSDVIASSFSSLDWRIEST